ncbi:hypothetical protein BJ742DRAFT_789577 [Cladochytrium replicatum]|nr:hypothetical protein BJ742DRAFT_789577 [Cladochytrium replicatum]
MSANLEQPPISVKATEKEEKNKERSKETPSIKEYSSELGDDYDSGDYHASWFEVRKSHSPLLLEHRGNGVPANIEESVTETDGPTEIEDPGKYMTHSDEIGATTRSVHVGSTLNPPSGLENSIDSQDEDHISGAIRKQNDSLLKQSSLSNEAPSTDSIHDQSASASARDKTEHESASPFTSEDELDGLFSSKNPADFAHLGCPGVSPTITARWRDPWAVPVGNVVYTIGQRLSRESGLLGNVEEHSQSQSSDSHDEMDHLMFGDDALEP